MVCKVSIGCVGTGRLRLHTPALTCWPMFCPLAYGFWHVVHISHRMASNCSCVIWAMSSGCSLLIWVASGPGFCLCRQCPTGHTCPCTPCRVGSGFLPLLPARISVPGADALRFGVTVALALGVDAVIGVDGASVVCWVGMRCLFLKLDISPLSSPSLSDLCGVVARGVVGPTLCSGEICCS